jgi:SAM-dependent methyltransferase
MIETTDLHQMWGAVALAWAAEADFVDARSESLTARMLELAQLAPGQRVLELACGPGGTGLAAAPLVAPGGRVVLSDVASEMVEIAAHRAAGLASVEARVRDLEAIDEPDASFDAALCREGLMLVSDPALAASEIRRVLRPGGRAVIAVWAARERNPWLSLIVQAMSAELGEPAMPDGVPHPFSLGDPDRLRAVLVEGGLVDVSVEEHPVPYRGGTPEEWWESRIAMAGPLAHRVRTLPAEVLAAARRRGLEAVRRYDTPYGLEIPGTALVAVGQRASAEA